MNKLICALFSILVAGNAFADTYQVTFGWTDPTSYLPSDEPAYEAKYRVAGGAEVVIPDLVTPGGSATVVANPGDQIEVAAQACNLGLCSGWTPWVSAAASYPPTQPGTQTGLTITVTRQ
jgi:hypothetical protein